MAYLNQQSFTSTPKVVPQAVQSNHSSGFPVYQNVSPQYLAVNNNQNNSLTSPNSSSFNSSSLVVRANNKRSFDSINDTYPENSSFYNSSKIAKL